MNRLFGIARCGLACCVCSEEVRNLGDNCCTGCESGKCVFAPNCINRKCSMEKGLKGCYECTQLCDEGVLKKTKVKGFIAFIQKYGIEIFMNCLEENEKRGIVYHRNGVVGDYDTCESTDDVISMLLE